MKVRRTAIIGQTNEKNMGENRKEDNGTKEIKERKNEGEG
jgi:hypothetical protein